MQRHSCSSARRAPGLPQHGGPPAPSGPEHRPGFPRLRSLAVPAQRQQRAGEGAPQLAERIGAGRGAPPGVGVSGQPRCWSGVFLCLGATCWSLTSIGDKSEEAAGPRLSAVGSVPQPARGARCGGERAPNGCRRARQHLSFPGGCLRRAGCAAQSK